MSGKPEYLYVVWKNYQRRAEVLSRMINAELVCMEHVFRSRLLRPIDYVLKLIASIRLIRLRRPDYVFVQSPPLYVAAAPLLCGTPYVVDGHNGIFNEFWGTLPFSRYLVNRADALLCHNQEIAESAKQRFPDANIVVLRDPVEVIGRPSPRRPTEFLFICSFDPDEPIDLIGDVIASCQEFEFVITASVDKLSSEHRRRLSSLKNLRLTGFLELDDYHAALRTCTAAIVLTSNQGTQPSGAVEALSADTPLLLSDTALTRQLFGGWATLTDHSVPTIVRHLKALAESEEVSLEHERNEWNVAVRTELKQLLHTALGQH